MQASIYSILPFDASLGTTIKFAWNGNQVFKNRCIIKKNDTNEVVYDNTITSFKLEHEIELSKASFVNGERYHAFIIVYDKDNIASDIQSLGANFLCLKTPTFTFTNLSEGQVIATSAYDFNLTYFQGNGELLDSWSVSVYTKTHSLLSTSNIQYNTENLSYTFSGFSNKNEYAIRAVGQTVNGISMDTGFINISVTYSIRDIFSLLEPTNMKEIGAIQIRSNIVSSEGHLKHDPAEFINNEYLDLRSNQITYSEGFQFEGDFSEVLLFYGITPNQEIAHLFDKNNELVGTVTYRIGKLGTNDLRRCFELRLNTSWSSAVYYSNKIPLQYGDDKIGLCIFRSNGLWNIEATIYEDGTPNSWNMIESMDWKSLDAKSWNRLQSELI